MAPTGWGRGYVSAEKLKRDNAEIARMTREKNERRRAEMKLLSDRDMAIVMAEVIVDVAGKGRAIVRRDFENVGLPAGRLEANKKAAMHLARKREPRIDAMLAAITSLVPA